MIIVFHCITLFAFSNREPQNKKEELTLLFFVCGSLAVFAKITSPVMNGLTPFRKEFADMRKMVLPAARVNAAQTDKRKENVICFVDGYSV